MIFLILCFLRRYLTLHGHISSPNPPSPLFLMVNPQDTPGLPVSHFNFSLNLSPIFNRVFAFYSTSDTPKFEKNTKLLVGVRVLSLFSPTAKCGQTEAVSQPSSLLAAAPSSLNQPTLGGRRPHSTRSLGLCS